MNLSEKEIILLKNILRSIGKNDEVEEQIAIDVGMELSEFQEVADSAYNKLKEYIS